MVLWISFSFFLFSLTLGHGDHDHDDSFDDEVKAFSPEGGCDDGVTGADVDLPSECRDPATWNTCSTWTCKHDTPWDFIQIGQAAGATASIMKEDPQRESSGGHKCINANTTALYPVSKYPNGIPTNGYHRPKWPVYGEYLWVPPLRYIHSLEHGAVVFMYHPCTPTELVEKFRKLATTCLWKHLFFRFKGDLGREWPMAMVTYGHLVKINDINDGNIEQLRAWIREKALVGGVAEDGQSEGAVGYTRAGRTFGDGTYNLTIQHKADIVTVLEDNAICPMPTGEGKTEPINVGEIINPPGLDAHDEHGDGELLDEILDQVDPVAPVVTTTVPSPVAPVQPIVPQATVAQTVPSVQTTTAPVVTVKPESVPPEAEINPVTSAPPAALPALPVVTPAGTNPPGIIVNTPKITEPAAPISIIPEVPKTTSSTASTTSTTSPTVTSTTTTSTTPFDMYGELETTSFGYDSYNVNNYMLENYFDDPEPDPLAADETDVGNTSEPIWAFLSLSILVVGLAAAVYKSQLCKRPVKNKYNQNQDSWSDDEASMSVGTLMRGFRRKSKDHGEVSYALLKAQDEEDV